MHVQSLMQLRKMGNGGDIIIYAGSGTGSGSGGNVTITSGPSEKEILKTTTEKIEQEWEKKKNVHRCKNDRGYGWF